jgi:hypothetical protein
MAFFFRLLLCDNVVDIIGTGYALFFMNTLFPSCPKQITTKRNCNAKNYIFLLIFTNAQLFEPTMMDIGYFMYVASWWLYLLKMENWKKYLSVCFYP